MKELVIIEKGQPITTSLIVAEVFNKEHKRVMQDIRELHCSKDFHERNFVLSFSIRELPNEGSKKEPYCNITKDGFSFLVLGYTGEKAGQWKEKFINGFNKRDALLKSDDYILARGREIMENRIISLESSLEQKDQQITLQENTIKQQSPKAEYYDNVLDSKKLTAINVVAMDMGITAQTLNKHLKKRGIIYKVNGTYVLSAKYRGRDLARTKTFPYVNNEGKECTAKHLYWTEKGREFILNLFNHDTQITKTR